MEKLVEKYGSGTQHVSYQKGGGGKGKSNHKSQDLSPGSENSMKGKEIVEIDLASNALQIVPLAFSFPSHQEVAKNLEGSNEDGVCLDGIVSIYSQEGQSSEVVKSHLEASRNQEGDIVVYTEGVLLYCLPLSGLVCILL